jgi:hypothetical protein
MLVSLFAEGSACVVLSPRPLSVRFRGVPVFSASVVNGTKSEPDPKRKSDWLLKTRQVGDRFQRPQLTDQTGAAGIV